MSCANYRHDEVNLRAGEMCGDFVGIRGQVVVCRRCKVLVRGDEGGEYLFGRSRLRVMNGNAVFVATVSDQERVRLLPSQPTSAWNIEP